MTVDVRPATSFDDVATMVGPKRPDANVCWCLTYRLPGPEHRALSGPARGGRVRDLVAEGPPGVLAYDGEDVVGWAAQGTPAREGYPVDNRGEKVDLTMAYVGTRRLFERAGFVKAADTDSVLNGFPRVLMRLDLR